MKKIKEIYEYILDLLNMEGELLYIAGNDKLPEPLSAEEEKELKQDFVNANLRLVLSLVKKFNHRCDNVDDLFQVGVVGLIKTVDNFDISQNVQFSTYAVPMIYP